MHNLFIVTLTEDQQSSVSNSLPGTKIEVLELNYVSDVVMLKCTMYCRCSNYASFLILRQNANFKPIISNDVSFSGNSFPIVASHGLAGSKCGQ